MKRTILAALVSLAVPFAAQAVELHGTRVLPPPESAQARVDHPELTGAWPGHRVGIERRPVLQARADLDRLAFRGCESARAHERFDGHAAERRHEVEAHRGKVAFARHHEH
jgi:hypothetical protein